MKPLQVKNLPPHLQRQILGDRPGRGRGGNKYGVASEALRTLDGIVFDSAWELHVYQALLRLTPKVAIRRQVWFELAPKGRDAEGKAFRAIAYVADFVVDDCCVIDAKGARTQMFRLKLKLFQQRYAFPLHLVYRRQFGRRGYDYQLQEYLRKIIDESHKFKERVVSALQQTGHSAAPGGLPDQPS